MKVVDTKGMLCPAPLIATRKALKEASLGEIIRVVTDNSISLSNLKRYLKDNNPDFQVSDDEGSWMITIRKSKTEEFGGTKEYCQPETPHFEKSDTVVVISSDRMGEGDDKLGRLLLENFIRALKDLDRLPSKIVFYNKGVTLVASDAPAIADLIQLERMGVELILCGTCVNHYKLNDKIGAGTISNVFSITELMASSARILKP